MKRALVGVLKVLLVAALFWWVFTNVQWDDALVRTDAGQNVISSIEGEILGPWDSEVVRFRGPDGVIEVDTGPVGDGSSVAVVPGLITYFVHLDKLWFALGALCFLVTLVVSAIRWWWLLRVNELTVRFREALRFTWIGVFFNNVVPGQTGGDVVKALYIVKRCPEGRVAALMSVVVDRILGLGSLALLGAIVVLFQLERFGLLALGIWGVLGLVAAIGVVAFSRRVRKLVRLDQILRRLPQKLSTPLMKVDRAIFFYRTHKRGIFAWLLIGALNHVMTIASFYLMGVALGVGMPAEDYFALIPVILIASAVPIAPNGWGYGEALFGYMFGTYGAVHLGPAVPDPTQVMRTRGVALSVLYRLHTTLWSLIGGVMLLTDRDRVTRAEFEAEVALEHAEDRARATPSAR